MPRVNSPARTTQPLRIRPNDMDVLEEAMHRRQRLDARVLRKVKGGFIVDVGHATGFLPMSLLDTGPVRHPEEYVGKTLHVHVVRFSPAEGALTLSRRSVVEEQMGLDRMALMDSLKIGANMEGVVCALTDFGAFVDLGGIQGLIPLGAWSNKPGAHPSQYVAPGQLVNVSIKTVVKDKCRVRIGLSKPF